jgi:ketosteroid isomerase-like protein
MNRWLWGLSAACTIAWPQLASSAADGTALAERQVLRVNQEWADAETFINDLIGDTNNKISSQEMSDVSVHVRGDAAVVVGIDTARGTSDGQPYVYALRCTVTYIKRDGHWVALAEQFARAVDLKADEAAIRKADADWVQTAQSMQVDAWLAFYTEDAIVLPPNDKMANGREGDIAYLIGAYSLKFNDAAGKPQTDQGKLLEVWKKQPDATWKCSADTWNSDLPAP